MAPRRGAALRDFYSAHGNQVALGGTLLIWSAVCFGVFGTALWSRARDRAVPAVAAGLVLLGAAVDTVAQLYDSGIFRFLGEHGADGRIAPAALPGLAAAGHRDRHVRRNGAADAGRRGRRLRLPGAAPLDRRAGVALVAAQFTPAFFVASLLFLLWAAVAGVALAVRPSPRPLAAREAALAVG